MSLVVIMLESVVNSWIIFAAADCRSGSPQPSTPAKTKTSNPELHVISGYVRPPLAWDTPHVEM